MNEDWMARNIIYDSIEKKIAIRIIPNTLSLISGI